MPDATLRSRFPRFPTPLFIGPFRSVLWAYPPTSSYTKFIANTTDWNNVLAGGGNLVNGDIVLVRAGNYNFGSGNGANFQVNLGAGTAQVYFEPGAKIIGQGPGGINAVNFMAVGVQCYGGEITFANPTGPSGDALTIAKVFSGTTFGPQNLRWWGLRIHDVPGNGIQVANTNDVNVANWSPLNIDIDAEIWNTGLNPSQDVHTVKGTGQHPVYWGANLEGVAPGVTGLCSVFSHDNSTSFGDIQVGSQCGQTTFWIRAFNMLFDNPAQNSQSPALTVFGQCNNLTIASVEAVNVAGPVVMCESLDSATPNVNVQFGRGWNALASQNARNYYANHGNKYQTTDSGNNVKSITYTNCI